MNISSIFFYLLLYGTLNNIVENIFIIILIFVIFIIIQIILTIRAFKKYIKKTELIKDVQSNKFEINTLNYFNNSISKITLDLNSINFYDVSYEYITDDDYSYNYGLIIVNTFQNKSILDLDRSDIRNKPRKIFYLLEGLKNGNNKNELCAFVGCSPTDKPIFLDIDKYIGKPWNKECHYYFGKYKINKYMKMSETFFSFYLDKKIKTYDFLFSFDIVFVFLGFAGIFILFYFKIDIYKKIISFIVYILLIFIFHFLYIYSVIKGRKCITRIDIIYSSNFDRIFIGLVDYYEKSFSNTFLFDINSIEKFILEPKNKRKTKNILKVILKNGENQTIYQINENEPTLIGLLFILNEKLNNKNEQVSNNDNYLVKNWE